MSGDLTRWNRAGLNRLTYVDANAVTLLERLRQEVLDRFGTEWDPTPPTVEDDITHRYAALPHGDAGWELLRAVARATHVVTAHVDAYANEAYLRTATQAAFLRQMVTLLDFHPAPSSSATTALAFSVKASAVAPVAVAAGTAVRFQPADGPAIVFETLLPLAADRALDELRCVDADRNPTMVSGDTIALAEETPLVLGAPIVLADGPHRHAARVAAMGWSSVGAPLVSIAPPPPGDTFTVGGTLVHSDPRDRFSVTGPTRTEVACDSDRWLRLARTPTDLRPNDVAWITGGSTVQFVGIQDVGAHAVRLTEQSVGRVGTLPLNAKVGLAIPVAVEAGSTSASVEVLGDWSWLDGHMIGVGMMQTDFEARWEADEIGRNLAGADSLTLASESESEPSTTHDREARAARTRSAPDHETGIVVLSAVGAPLGEVARAAGQIKVIQLFLDAGEALRPYPVGPDLLAGVKVQAGGVSVGRSEEDGEPPRTMLTFQTQAPFTPEWIFVRADADKGVAVEAELRGAGGGLPSTLRTSELAHATSGDWFVLAGEAGITVAEATSVQAGSAPVADVVVDRWSQNGTFYPSTTAAFSHFARSTRLHRWDRNDQPVNGNGPVALAEVPHSLEVGRPVLVEHVPEVEAEADPVGVVTRVLRLLRAGAGAGTAEVTFGDPVPEGATVGSLRVRANVAPAGHGETKPATVIGSGAAATVNQRFVLPVTGVATVPDPAFASGARHDLELTIQGRVWQQVPSLRDAEPDDHVYVTRLAEDGRVEVLLGDGVHGRRPPTGADNVVCRWRVGAGPAGNLPVGTLVELVRPVNGIEAVQQPLAAAGGGDGDTPEAIRANAPAHVLALDRAVSLADFESLAAGRADVWQARAFELPWSTLGAGIEVVVVPAGGGPLAEFLKKAIAASLAAASAPDVQVTVRGHVAVPLELELTISVRAEAFDPERVRMATLELVRDRFSPRNRQLGQRLTREEVVLVAESVDGVENVRVIVREVTGAAATANAVVRDPGGSIRLVHAERDQLIALDPSSPAVTVMPEEFRL